MKFHYMAHDNQSKSMKQLWPGKLSSFNWKRKMEETNWSSDFYSDIFSLDFDSLFNTIDLESLGNKENRSSCGRASTSKVETNHFFFLFGIYFLH